MLDGAVFAGPAVEESAADVGASVERRGEHERGVGEACEFHSTDVLDVVERNVVFGRSEVDVEVTGEVVRLEGAEGLLLDGRDVVFVRKADHRSDLIEGGDVFGVGLGIISREVI